MLFDIAIRYGSVIKPKKIEIYIHRLWTYYTSAVAHTQTRAQVSCRSLINILLWGIHAVYATCLLQITVYIFPRRNP